MLQTILGGAPQIIIALLVFGILIFIHELGHFMVAKRSNIKVNEFAMGMGPAILKRQKGETVYALRLFPIGGFCALEGDDAESDDLRSFGHASLPKRMMVMLAGSAMNLLLGLLILGILSARQPLIGTTMIAKFDETAVTNQWLQVGDSIKKINNHRVRTANDIMYEFSRDRDGVMDILVARQDSGGKTGDVLLQGVTFPMVTLAEGVQMPDTDFNIVGVPPTFGKIILNSFNWTASIIKQVWGSFSDLLTGRYGVNQLSGPVGLTKVVSEAAKQATEKTPDGGIDNAAINSFLMLVAFITVNLGVFNLLPLPALDGGRLIFLLIEAVRRKPVNPRYEGYVHGVGFMLLIGLMLFVTFNDITKL